MRILDNDFKAHFFAIYHILHNPNSCLYTLSAATNSVGFEFCKQVANNKEPWKYSLKQFAGYTMIADYLHDVLLSSLIFSESFLGASHTISQYCALRSYYLDHNPKSFVVKKPEKFPFDQFI